MSTDTHPETSSETRTHLLDDLELVHKTDSRTGDVTIYDARDDAETWITAEERFVFSRSGSR